MILKNGVSHVWSFSSLKRANGAPVASIADTTDVQQIIVTDESDVSHHRVFLLGENRWEEPSRLSKGSRSKSSVGKGTTNCISCRGEGRLLCMGTTPLLFSYIYNLHLVY